METPYFKNKVTEDIAEYDSVMGLFYILGKKFTDGSMIPISPLAIASDPNWEEYTGPIPEIDPASKARNKFTSWLKGK